MAGGPGLRSAHFRPCLQKTFLFSGRFLALCFAFILAWKLILVTVILIYCVFQSSHLYVYTLQGMGKAQDALPREQL